LRIGGIQGADVGALITWRGYYDIAGTGETDKPSGIGGFLRSDDTIAPLPASCAALMASSLNVLDQFIASHLPANVRFVNTDALLHDQTKLIQGFYKQDIGFLALAQHGITVPAELPGWPHPNTAGAKAVAGQVTP
jgi:hypothetical protein